MVVSITRGRCKRQAVPVFRDLQALWAHAVVEIHSKFSEVADLEKILNIYITSKNNKLEKIESSSR